MPLLELAGVSKSFGGIVALHEVTLAVAEGEPVGLVGPNGAGKTTLFDCIAGLLEPEAGSIRFGGRRVDGLPPFRRSRLGMARTFQRLELFSGMTPLEHLLVTERTRQGTGRLWKDLVGLGRPTRAERREADALLDLVGLADVADQPVEVLGLGRARLVELARALAAGPRLLMLDEPSSGLDDDEREALASAIERARRELGAAVLLVEHDLDLVAEVVSRLVVLDAGKVIADGGVSTVLADEGVRRAYLGAAR